MIARTENPRRQSLSFVRSTGLAAALAAALVSGFAAAPAGAAEAPPATAPPEGGNLDIKAFPLTSKLVLPYFEIEKNDPNGDTVLYALRNESTAPIEVDIKYYEIDSPFAPQRTDRVTLAAKQIHPVNIRDVQNLEIDPDGRARGYVRFEVVGGASVLAGDFFRVDPGDNFASGYRLVNADPASASDERCSILSFRFLRGGLFSGGTRIFYWLDMNVLPQADTIAYSIYNEAGTLITTGLLGNTDRVASQLTIDQLLVGPAAALNSGAVEFQFSGGVLGHVAGAINASGRFSVGFEGVCRD